MQLENSEQQSMYEDSQNEFETIYHKQRVRIYKIPNKNKSSENDPDHLILKCSIHNPYLENKCTAQCQLLKNEYNIHQQLLSNNPNQSNSVVQHHAFQQNTFVKDEKCCFIEMEYCKFGDLSDIILKHPKNHLFFEEKCIKSLMLQVLKSVKSVHDQNISVNDIKFENFFVSELDFPETEEQQEEEDQGEKNKIKIELKLGDLAYGFEGGSRNKFQQAKVFGCKLRDIMSPELIKIADIGYSNIPRSERKNAGIDEKLADIYALGAMFFQIFTRVPFSNFQKHNQLMQKLLKKEYVEIFETGKLKSFLEPIDKYCHEKKWEILDFIVSMLQENPLERRSLGELIQILEN